MLLAFYIHPNSAEDVVSTETLAVHVDHQNLDLVPAPLLQLLELLDARLDGLAADGAAGYPDGRRHLRQNLLVFPGGDPTQ